MPLYPVKCSNPDCQREDVVVASITSEVGSARAGATLGGTKCEECGAPCIKRLPSGVLDITP